ncbi:MAG: LexA family transcriptional regulator [Acetobacter sp.]|nr:LexA family transcriptional regulator [Acetobacter sp.]
MADLEGIRKRLAKLITERGLTYRDISLTIGRKDAYIQQYIKYGLPKRLSEIDRKKVCHLLDIAEEELLDDELIIKGYCTPLISNDTSCVGHHATDYMMIDIYDPRPGVDFFSTLIGRMSLNRQEFAPWCGANPSTLRIIRLNGDYMAPTIPAGSLVLYDTSSSSHNGDGIYVVQNNKNVQVKHVQTAPGETFVLISENKLYPNITYPQADVEILGRVISCLTPRIF